MNANEMDVANLFASLIPLVDVIGKEIVCGQLAS